MISKKLPVVAPTTFTAARLDGPGGLHLFFGGTSVGREFAFSLPSAVISGVEHCPGSTPTCRSVCNAGADQTYEHNAATIRAILADDDLGSAWVMALAGWIRENAPDGFRWHDSGDVFSADYATWIADVCAESPEVDHKIYTRSFDEKPLGALARASTLRGGNLMITLSCDYDNYHQAFWSALRHGVAWQDAKDGQEIPLRLCYLTTDKHMPGDLPEGSEVVNTGTRGSSRA